MLARRLLRGQQRQRQQRPPSLLVRAWTPPLRSRPSLSWVVAAARAYHHFTRKHGLAILRTSVTASSVAEAVAEANRAWESEGTTARPFLHVLHVHEPDRLIMEGPSPSSVPVVAVTAERNQLDIDLRPRRKPQEGTEGEGAAVEEEDSGPALVSLTKGPRRRPRPRRAPRTMEDLKGAAATAAEDEEEEEEEDGGALDDQSTGTVVSVGLEGAAASPEVVLFQAPDASFPDLPGRSLHEMLADAEGRLQPHTFLFANPGSFPLLELAQRLETVFHKHHVVASFTRGIQSERPRLLGIPAREGAAATVGGAVSTDAPSPALGVAIFGGGLGTEHVADMTRAFLGSSWLGNFAVDTALQKHLFVPSHFTAGPQPVCQRYRAVEEAAFAEELPLFRLQSVLYPGCGMLLKVFEPRYRRMIKRCLEEQEPFGLIHAEAAVGTLCSITEVYMLNEESGISILKVTGYRRFSLEGGTHVPPDSFGLLLANRAAFYEEEPLQDDEVKELADLYVQAEACIRLHNPEASLLPGAAAREGGGSETPSAEELVGASFALCQYLIDHYGTGISERRKLEWLAGTSSIDRMRDCLDLLLQNVRRGVGGAGGALAAAQRAAEQGGGGGSSSGRGGSGLPSGGRRGRGRGREQD